MQQIKFHRGGSNTILGNFAPGDIARCSDELARHLVVDVKVATYKEDPTQQKPRRQGRR